MKPQVELGAKNETAPLVNSCEPWIWGVENVILHFGPKELSLKFCGENVL